jgi:hypothetical protein|tara:strand:+ start:2054 stop:2227 length:174 start_codon:yes stop_codon:yes gene_type:complete
MIVFSYLRNPKKLIFKKCRPCVTHKLCKLERRCQALDFEGDENVSWKQEKRLKKNKA